MTEQTIVIGKWWWAASTAPANEEISHCQAMAVHNAAHCRPSAGGNDFKHAEIQPERPFCSYIGGQRCLCGWSRGTFRGYRCWCYPPRF